MKPISEKEWLEDFRDFVKGDGTIVPEATSQVIHDRIRSELSPSAWIVFFKLLGIHAVVGTLSLAICDQFGMSPFRFGFSLANYFMKFGHSACMTLCGVLFISLTVAASGLIMRGEELRVLYRNSMLQTLGLSAVSLGIFAALGAEIAFSLGALWFLGAEFGGLSASLFFRPKAAGS
jgi:hypothetical protein